LHAPPVCGDGRSGRSSHPLRRRRRPPAPLDAGGGRGGDRRRLAGAAGRRLGAGGRRRGGSGKPRSGVAFGPGPRAEGPGRGDPGFGPGAAGPHLQPGPRRAAGDGPGQAQAGRRMGPPARRRYTLSLQRIGILLTAYGTPDSLEDVEPYLTRIRRRYAYIRGDKRPAPEMVQDLRNRYRAVGGRSPLTEITRRQAEALERRLNQGAGEARFKAFVGMKHWHPFIHDTVAAI